MEERIDVIGIDLVQEHLTGRYDVALLRNFIQVLGPESAAKSLQHVGEAMQTGGEIYIVGYVLNDDRPLRRRLQHTILSFLISTTKVKRILRVSTRHG